MSTTPNYGLTKPAAKSVGWGEDVNTNFDTIDTQLKVNADAIDAAGDVTGPASSTNNNVAFFNGITGKLIKDSGLTLSGSNTGDESATSIKTKLGITTLSGSNTGDQTLPVKATGAEADTGTDDAKFLTAKAAKDSHNIPSVVPGTSGNVLTSNGTDWTSATPASGAVATELSFVNADLSAGVLTVTHNKGLSTGYTALVNVINNSGAIVFPDAVNTFAANSFKVDLTSYGALTGTWYVIYITK